MISLLVALATVACQPAAGTRPAAEDDRLLLATTVAPITDIVASIAGRHASVAGIVPEGTNSHTFEPRPSSVELLSTVDVLFANGLGLEEPTLELARENLPEGAELVELGDRVLETGEELYDFSFPRSEGRPNPHTWTHPGYAVAYAEVVAEVLARRDPENAASYSRNLDSFRELFQELDAAMREAFATVPEERRRLLTYHDSFAYFARDYEGWEVVGAIQVSDFSDPSPRRVAELIEQIRAEDVPAIFGSEVFPSEVLAQIAAETGAEYVDDLRDDDLPGSPGDAEHSLAGLLRFDFITITEALGGDATALRAFTPRPVSESDVDYPQ